MLVHTNKKWTGRLNVNLQAILCNTMQYYAILCIDNLVRRWPVRKLLAKWWPTPRQRELCSALQLSTSEEGRFFEIQIFSKATQCLLMWKQESSEKQQENKILSLWSQVPLFTHLASATNVLFPFLRNPALHRVLNYANVFFLTFGKRLKAARLCHMWEDGSS